MVAIWWLPLGASALHIVEEFLFPGGFAAWDRAYRPEFARGITPRFHFMVNAALLVFGAVVGIAGMGSEGYDLGVRTVIPPDYAAAAWLTLAALLFSNTVFHVVGAVKTKSYSPGIVTGMLFYVPMTVWGYGYFVSHDAASIGTAIAAAAIGGSYHLWASLRHRAASRNRETA